MKNRLNNISRKAKVEFLKKLRAGDPHSTTELYQLMSTEDLLKRLFKLLLPWMRENNFQNVESLEGALRQEGFKFNERLCQEAFEFYHHEKQ